MDEAFFLFMELCWWGLGCPDYTGNPDHHGGPAQTSYGEDAKRGRSRYPTPTPFFNRQLLPLPQQRDLLRPSY